MGITGSESTTAAGIADAMPVTRDPRERLWAALEQELPRARQSVAAAAIGYLKKVGRAIHPDVVHALSEETLQEVVRRVLQKPEAFDPERASPHAWFYGIALNVLREQHRAERRDRARIVSLDQPAQPGLAQDTMAPTIEDRLDDPAGTDPLRVMELLSLVSEPDRSILAWRYVERASTAEIAARLRVREGAARTRLCRALSKLEAAYYRAEAMGTGAAGPRQAPDAEDD